MCKYLETTVTNLNYKQKEFKTSLSLWKFSASQFKVRLFS
jgi:hypothetical protein